MLSVLPFSKFTLLVFEQTSLEPNFWWCDVGLFVGSSEEVRKALEKFEPLAAQMMSNICVELTECEISNAFDADVSMIPYSILLLFKTGCAMLESFNDKPNFDQSHMSLHVNSLTPLYQKLRELQHAQNEFLFLSNRLNAHKFNHWIRTTPLFPLEIFSHLSGESWVSALKFLGRNVRLFQRCCG